ncbi:hypothetical protein XENOCAPTIV_019731, partial [Xenoophorus captivus]
HVIILSKKLVDWLRYASIVQGGGASSGGFFIGPRSRQVSNLDLIFPVFPDISCFNYCFVFFSLCLPQSWMGQCQGTSSLCSAWDKDSQRTNG